jgi:LPS export ABC transporter permease LptG/LPS export ABC transporter permease LptF
MGILGRTLLKEISTGAVLGTVLFTFVLFLQQMGRLFEQLVSRTAQPEQIAGLFLLVMPTVLTFTIPVGVLVGVLIALGRMSSDGEIIAMRAAGVPSRHVLVPVALFALFGTALAGISSCVLTPWSIRETYRILNDMATAQLTAEIRPRIFEEQFSNRILYVEDVIPGPVVVWKNFFMADLRSPEERGGAGERGDGPRVTLAAQAIAVPDLENNRILLSLEGGSTFEVATVATEYYSTAFPQMQQSLDAPNRKEVRPPGYRDLDMAPLRVLAGEGNNEAAIEFHRRLALPLGCLVLGLVAIPLGVSSRKGGKSAAFVLTVALAFVYWMSMISCTALAKQQTAPVAPAIWAPNLAFFALAVFLLLRLERPGDRDWSSRLRAWSADWWGRLVTGVRRGKGPELDGSLMRFPLLPQLIDTYILSAFLYYFGLLVLSFVLMTHVFTFFELLGDILKNGIAMSRVATYHFFLTPKLIYDAAPMAVLVAVLITFGLLSKTNEVIALKACGVSVYRLALPVLFAGMLLSAGLFAFDYYVVPEANLIQDAIRNEIKGRPVQTFFRPDRKWIFGRGPWIYYYKHFDPDADVMVGVSVYELDRTGFRMRRHIYAESARWEPAIQRWVFQNGWSREFEGIRVTKRTDFSGETATFAELDEPPSYFLKEVKQDKQMNFHQLAAYITELRQSGVDTVRLQVQYQKKFSVPLFALIMALISSPFAFFSGNRGAMAPVGISLGIAICYGALSQLFEQMGNVGQLPAEMAAWSPDAIFSLAGAYFLLRVKT